MAHLNETSWLVRVLTNFERQCGKEDSRRGSLIKWNPQAACLCARGRSVQMGNPDRQRTARRHAGALEA